MQAIFCFGLNNFAQPTKEEGVFSQLYIDEKTALHRPRKLSGYLTIMAGKTSGA